MTHTLKRLGVKSVVALGLVLGAWTSSEGQRLYWLNYWSDAQVKVTGVSNTGVVVGTWGRGFRWHDGQFQFLTLPQGFSSSEANDISADGSVIVGVVRSSSDARPVRWLNGQPEFLDSYYWTPVAVSADGRVIVAFYKRWENGQVQQIPIDATDVSADGSVIVGTSDGCRSSHPARWTMSSGVQLLPLYDGDCYYDPWYGYSAEFSVSGVSGDGQTVIGTRHELCGSWVCELWKSGILWESPNRPYRALEGIQGFQYPRGISHDGRVIVGWGYRVDYDPDSGFPYIAEYYGFVYYREWGTPRRINQVYSSLLTDGSRLTPDVVSPNGRYIAGIGYNATRRRGEVFLLDTQVSGDVNGDGCVDDADLLAVLFNFGQSGSGLPEDVNSDGVVDDADLLEVLFNFGQGC